MSGWSIGRSMVYEKMCMIAHVVLHAYKVQ